MMILLIVATVAAVGFFFVLDKISEYPIERYMEESDYIETRIRKAVAGFQEYIAENRIYSRDAENIYKWVQEQKRREEEKKRKEEEQKKLEELKRLQEENEKRKMEKDQTKEEVQEQTFSN